MEVDGTEEFHCEYTVLHMRWKSLLEQRHVIQHAQRALFDYPVFLLIDNAKPIIASPTTHLLLNPPFDKTKAKMRFHIDENCNEYNAVVNALRWAGLTRCEDMEDANLYWGKPLSDFTILEDLPYQRVNHFPGNQALGSKTLLAMHINALQEEFPHIAIAPKTYLLPQQMPELTEACASGQKVHIFKPSNGSCGAGIHLFSKIEQMIPRRSRATASEYIPNPLLINGIKFDIRIYVIVTSLDPLRIYMFDDGLVRFATEPYDSSLDRLGDLHMHLTNYSINKSSGAYQATGKLGVHDEAGKVEVVADSGSKWSYKALLHYMKTTMGIDTTTMQKKINDLLVYTMFSVEDSMIAKMKREECPRFSCFENLGFDVLIDENLHPWLLEVNTYPSLSSSSPLDKGIKTKLTCDIFNLLAIPCFDTFSDNNSFDPVEDQYWVYSSERASDYTGLVTAKLDLEYLKMNSIDALLLREFYFERSRQRHMLPVFPSNNPASNDIYSKYMSTKRYNDLLLHKFVALGDQGTKLLEDFADWQASTV